jgi:hypothetical protein
MNEPSLFVFDADGPGERLFALWQDVMDKPRAKLDAKRQQRIRWALLNYSEDECEQAIRGCSMSDFHMGRNSRGKMYNDLTLIFRDAEHVEDFIDTYLKAASAKQQMQDWLEEEGWA